MNTSFSSTIPWCVVPAFISLNAHLNAAEKMTYVVISSSSGAKGYCWPSQKVLSQLVGCSLSTLKRCLRRLVELGLLAVEETVHGHTLCYYPLRPGGDGKPVSTVSSSKTENMVHSEPPLAQGELQINKVNIKRQISPLPPHAASTPPVSMCRPVRTEGDVSLTTFEKVWAAYPRKEAYGLAKSAFFRMRRSLPALSTLLDCISFKKDSWAGRETRYIPSLEYFLKGERWLDSDYVEYTSAPKAVPVPPDPHPELSWKAPAPVQSPEETKGIAAFMSSITRPLSAAERGVLSAFWRDQHRKGVTLTEQDGARFGNGTLFAEMQRLSMRAAV